MSTISTTKKVFRNDINGLKGLAIIAIVAYHFFVIFNALYASKISFFKNGYLGVDIFFVISGYLITSGIYSKLLSREFYLGEFYTHRLGRIIPPFVIMCAFTLAIGYFAVYTNVFYETGKEVISALLFVSNFYLAQAGGYFALDASDKLLMHTWYLAITIQFYLLHPIILLGIRQLVGLRKLPGTYTVLFILFFGLSCFFARSGQGYLLTECRIWELGFGALIFFNQKWIKETFLNDHKIRTVAIEAIGIVCIIANFIFVNQQNLWFISTSITTVIGTALIILCNNQNSLLNLKSLTATGKFSYSLYLWHWPIFIYVMRFGYSYSVLGTLCVIAVVLICTYISYKHFEKKKVPAFISLLVYCATFAGAIACVWYSGTNFMTKHENTSSEVMVQPDKKLSKDFKPKVFITENNVDVYKIGAQKLRPYIFFIGDSHAEHYGFYLRNINKIPMYYMYMHATVGYGSNFSKYKVEVISTQEERQTFNKIYKIMLENMKAGDEIVLANRWDVYYTYFLREKGLHDTDENFNKFVQALIEDFDEEISIKPQLSFNIVGQGITINQVSINCMRFANDIPFLKNLYNPKYCNAVPNVYKRMDTINNAFRAYAQSKDNVRFIDRNVPLHEKDGIYTIQNENGDALFFDKTHYSTAGGNIVGKYIIQQITKARTGSTLGL